MHACFCKQFNKYNLFLRYILYMYKLYINDLYSPACMSPGHNGMYKLFILSQ